MSSVLRAAIFLVLGPLIGEFFYFLMGTGQIAFALVAPFMFFIPAYMVGIIPALFSAVSIGLLRWRNFSHRRILILSAVIGAISTCLPLLAASLFIELKPSLPLAMLVIVGSLTCVICELSVVVLTNVNIELGYSLSPKETQFGLRPDAVFRSTSLSEIKIPVILGLLGLAAIAALWIVVIAVPQHSFPYLISDLSDIRGSWTRTEDRETIDFYPGALVGQPGNVSHSSFIYRGPSPSNAERVGDQFRFKFNKGLQFEIGPNSITGTPHMETVWETCLVRIWRQSAKQLYIEVDPKNSDPCRWFVGTFTKP